MQTIAAGLQLGDDRRLRAAQIAKMEAETQAIKAKNLGAPAPAPADASQEPLTPEAQEIANTISALQTKIGQNKVQMAQGDNRTGFLNLFSRQGEIDDANAKIAKLRAMQGGGAQVQLGAQAAQPGQQPAPQSTPGGANMVRIRTPQGAMKMIDRNMLPQALQQGATVAQ